MNTRNSKLEALLLFLLVFPVYGYFTGQKDANVNSRLSLVKAIVEEGRFEIDTYQKKQLSTIDKADFNGHFYSDKAIGSSLIGAAFYYPIHRLSARLNINLGVSDFRDILTLLAISLPCALIGPLIYFTVRQISGSVGKSLLITLAICLGTPYFKYSTAYYGHSLAGLFYFLAFYIWFQIRKSESFPAGKVFLSGLSLGLMFITEYPTAILGIPLLAYVLYILWRKNRIRSFQPYLWMGVGFLIPLSALLFYNHYVFGNAFRLSYAFEAEQEFRDAHAAGVMGIGLPDLKVLFYTTFHPTMGIFWQSPILLFAILGWVLMFKSRDQRAEWLFSIAAIALYFIALSGYYMWWGGWSFTPRHLIPVLPLFAIPLAYVFETWSPFMVIAAVISIGQNLIAAAGTVDGIGAFLERILTGKYISSYEGSIIYKVFLHNILENRISTNRGQQFLGLNGAWSLIPLILFELTAIIAVYWKISAWNKAEVNKS